MIYDNGTSTVHVTRIRDSKVKGNVLPTSGTYRPEVQTFVNTESDAYFKAVSALIQSGDVGTVRQNIFAMAEVLSALENQIENLMKMWGEAESQRLNLIAAERCLESNGENEYRIQPTYGWAVSEPDRTPSKPWSAYTVMRRANNVYAVLIDKLTNETDGNVRVSYEVKTNCSSPYAGEPYTIAARLADFDSDAESEKYILGRMAAFDKKYFFEENPVVPANLEKHFKIDGIFNVQGYRYHTD